MYLNKIILLIILFPRTIFSQIDSCNNLNKEEINKHLIKLIEKATNKKSNFIEELNSIKNKSFYHCEKIKLLIFKQEIIWNETNGINPNIILNQKKELYQLALKNNNLKVAGTTLKDIGKIYFVQKKYNLAYLNLNEALKIAELSNDSLLKGNSLKIIGLIEDKLNNPRKSINTLLKSLNYSTNSSKNEARFLFQVYQDLNYMYSKIKKYDSAEFYYKKIQPLIPFYGINGKLMYDKTNIIYEYNKENYDKTLKLIDTFLNKYNYSRNDNSLKIEIFKYKYLCLKKLNKKDSMLSAIDSIYEYSKNRISSTKNLFLIKYEYYKSKNDYKNALFYFEKYYDFYDSSNIEKYKKEIQLYDKKIATLKQEERIKQIEKDKNNLKKQRWLFALITTLILLIPFLVLILRSKRKKKEYEAKLSQMQMATLKSQMNPHFMFNSINNIKGHIINNAVETAADHLTKFSKLMRNILNYSDSENISLKNEIEFIKLYIELETFKNDKHIQFVSEINDEIDQENIKIIPFIIQPIIENCLKHAFKNNFIQNKITLRINQNLNWLNIEIEDNGIGLKDVKNSEHESKATSLIEKRLELNNGKKNNIHWLYRGEGKGTFVNLILKIL